MPEPMDGTYLVLHYVPILASGVPQTLLKSNVKRVWASIELSQAAIGSVLLTLGQTPVAGVNYDFELLGQGATVIFDQNMPWAGDVQGVCTGGATCPVFVCEVYRR